jgi:hypothetical protein
MSLTGRSFTQDEYVTAGHARLTTLPPCQLLCRARLKLRRPTFAGPFVLAVLFALSGAARAEEEEARGPCFDSLSECPRIGCGKEGTPDALVNRIKRTVPRSGTPVRLTLDDFAGLQDQATQLVGQGRKASLDQEARAKLRGLKLQSVDREVSEGDLIEIGGFLIGLPNRPKASGPESVNCRLSGATNNDFHIPVGSAPSDTEFEGIVVEMIPQDRKPGWTVKKLKRIAKEERPVIIRGQLLYDNKHRVNDDPDQIRGGDPKRMSLWEIHPVTEFFVCMTANKKCTSQNVNTQQWVRLEQVRD